MPVASKNPSASQNPWGGVTYNGQSIPSTVPQDRLSIYQAPANQSNPQAQTGAGAQSINNLNLLGDTSGAIPPGGSLMPEVPDYLGQAAGRFNNFQPLDLGNSPNLDPSQMFSHYGAQYDKLNNSPQIPIEDVVSGQQQEQMLNSAIGANANQRQSAMQDAISRLGSRGFTSESPALQATNNRLGLNEAIANTQARVDIPLRTAQQNADYRLQAMQANAQQRQGDINSFIGLENAQTNRLSPMLQALVGLI